MNDLRSLLRELAPRLDERGWCFAAVTPQQAPEMLGAALGTFRESEGVTAIVPPELAPDQAPVFARIVLEVYSDLEGVGLTAAVAGALASSGIPCNIVAALNHDHVFVPWARGEEALSMLTKLSETAS